MTRTPRRPQRRARVRARHSNASAGLCRQRKQGSCGAWHTSVRALQHAGSTRGAAYAQAPAPASALIRLELGSETRLLRLCMCRCLVRACAEVVQNAHPSLLCIDLECK
jgi:hypothetical protein